MAIALGIFIGILIGMILGAIGVLLIAGITMYGVVNGSEEGYMQFPATKSEEET